MHIVPCGPNSRLLPGAGWSDSFIDQLWSSVISNTTKYKALSLKSGGISFGSLSTSHRTVSETWKLQSHVCGMVKLFRKVLLKEQLYLRLWSFTCLFAANLPRISRSFTKGKAFLRRRAEIYAFVSPLSGTRETNFRQAFWYFGRSAKSYLSVTLYFFWSTGFNSGTLILAIFLFGAGTLITVLDDKMEEGSFSAFTSSITTFYSSWALSSGTVS